MKVEIVGKNGFIPTEANKDYAIKKLGKLEDLLRDYENAQARVVCKVYKAYHKVEVTIPTKNIILRAEVQDVEINAAIDQVIDKLVAQLRRYNDKAKSKMGKQGIRSVGVNDEQDEKFERVKFLDLVPMTSEDALDQMELLGHDFFIYQDKETKKTNVIYLREDGNYAIIETTTK
jgi:putative sigma-54 modulation protein